jgi:tryptophan synthase alpha chain
MQYGVEKFCKEASASGVDGVILPDLPLDEFQSEYRELFEKHNLTNTFLISPTTSLERIRLVDQSTKGFIYAVSSSSTTGAKSGFSGDQETYFQKLQSLGLQNPYLIGFGISNHATFSKACSQSSGAIVGSAFITMLKSSSNLQADVTTFVKTLRNSK